MIRDTQSAHRDNRESTLFSWLHIYCAHLASVGFEHSVYRGSLMIPGAYIYIYIYMLIYIYIYIYIYICICILYGNLKFKSHFWNNVSTFVFQCLYTRLKYTLCLDMKMSNKNLFKKTLKKQLYLRFFKDIKTAH